MDPFIIQLAIIFIPGMIWERIDALCVQKRRPSQFEVIRRSFVFGLSAYLMTYIFYHSVGAEFKFVDLKTPNYILSIDIFYEIIFASLMALVLSIPYTWIINRGFHYRFFQYIRITKRFGDEDVWDFTFNSRNDNLTYVHIRDFNKKITYAGWVKLYSETEKIRELVLSNVILYDFDGNKILEAPNMYLARAMDDIDIEFPTPDIQGDKK